MIPSLLRATANLMLQKMNNKHTKLGVSLDDAALIGPHLPARANVDVADLVGHHGKFCHQFDHMVAVQHHIALATETTSFKGHASITKQSSLVWSTVPSAFCLHWACAGQRSHR